MSLVVGFAYSDANKVFSDGFVDVVLLSDGTLLCPAHLEEREDKATFARGQLFQALLHVKGLSFLRFVDRIDRDIRSTVNRNSMALDAGANDRFTFAADVVLQIVIDCCFQIGKNGVKLRTIEVIECPHILEVRVIEHDDRVDLVIHDEGNILRCLRL